MSSFFVIKESDIFSPTLEKGVRIGALPLASINLSKDRYILLNPSL